MSLSNTQNIFNQLYDSDSDSEIETEMDTDTLYSKIHDNILLNISHGFDDIEKKIKELEDDNKNVKDAMKRVSEIEIKRDIEERKNRMKKNYGSHTRLCLLLLSIVDILESKGKERNDWYPYTLSYKESSKIRKITEIVELFEIGQFNSGMTSKNLALKKIQDQKGLYKKDSVILGEMMEFLHKNMTKQLKHIQTKDLRFHRDCDFVKLLPETMKRFFTNIVDHSSGDYQGELLSLNSWYIGNQQKIYITTYEGYGSCSGCDHIASCENQFSDLIYFNEELDTFQNEIKLLNGDINSIKNELRKFTRSYVEDEIHRLFLSLNFHESFNDARKEILKNSDGEEIEFKKSTYDKKTKSFNATNMNNFPSI